MDEIYARRAYYESLPDRKNLEIEKTIAVTFPGTSIPHKDQLKIIEAIKYGGIKSGGTYTPNSRGPCWQSLAIRGITPENLPPPLHMNMPNLSFQIRHLRNIQWTWMKTDITEMVKDYLKPVLGIFTHLSRVRGFLQIPGETITFHRDLSPGNYYYTEHAYTNRVGPNRHKYLGTHEFDSYHFPDSDNHAKQNYFALKVPLTEIENNYGPQAIVVDKPYVYSHGGDMYLMNEFCHHGVDAVPFYRGLIFADGLISLEAVNKLKTGHLMIKEAYKFSQVAV